MVDAKAVLMHSRCMPTLTLSQPSHRGRDKQGDVHDVREFAAAVIARTSSTVKNRLHGFGFVEFRGLRDSTFCATNPCTRFAWRAGLLW